MERGTAGRPAYDGYGRCEMRLVGQGRKTQTLELGGGLLVHFRQEVPVAVVGEGHAGVSGPPGDLGRVDAGCRQEDDAGVLEVMGA